MSTDILIPIGHNETGNITCNISDLSHLLIIGTTSSGKTTYVRSVLADLIREYTPDDIQFIICDSKRVDYQEYVVSDALTIPVITDSHKCRSLINWLSSQIELRLHDYDALATSPHLLCVFDDYSLFDFDDSAIYQLTRILTDGRRAKIHIWIVTSAPISSREFRSISTSLPFRMSFRTTSKELSKEVIGKDGAELLRMPGDILFFFL